MVMSGVTDPYQPVERRLKITRGCLQVLAKFRTRSASSQKIDWSRATLICSASSPRTTRSAVNISVTSLDRELQRVMEPRTSPPRARLEAIAELHAAGIPVGVMVGPVIPGLTDHEMPAILEAAGKAGAQFAGHVVLRLPWAVAPLFNAGSRNISPIAKRRSLAGFATFAAAPSTIRVGANAKPAKEFSRSRSRRCLPSRGVAPEFPKSIHNFPPRIFASLTSS